MASPRPESKENEEITLDTLKQRMMDVWVARWISMDEFLDISDPFFSFLKNDPRVTPELLAQFFIEPSGLDDVPMMLSLFFDPFITHFLDKNDIDKLINKASPDILIKVNRDNLTTFINDYIKALSKNVKGKDGPFSSEKFINPFLSILRILSRSHDTGPFFRKVFENLITRIKVKSQQWPEIDSENYRAMLIKLEAKDFQYLREAARYNYIYQARRYQSIFDTLIGDEIEHKDLFQILLQTLGFDGLAELLGNIRDFHAKRFPFFKKINSIFETEPGQHIPPRFESNQYFDKYFKFLASPVNYFRENPDKCMELIIALTAFSIESACFKKNEELVSALRKITEYLELNPDQDRLRIIMYFIAKCHYATFLAKQEKSEEFSVMLSSKLAAPKSLSKETKESALIDFKEKEEKIAKKLQKELAPVVVDQLEYHNRAVEIWLNILPERLPASVVVTSDLALIGDALRGCIKNPAFQHIRDSVAIQIRALQYYYQAASSNDRDAIQAIELMAGDMGVLTLSEFKDKQKTKQKGPFKFFSFDRKAEEEKKQSAEPTLLDEDKDEEVRSWKILYAKIIKQLKFQRIENLINVISQRVPSSDISKQLQAMLANLAKARKSKTPATYIMKIAEALPDLATHTAKIKIEKNQRTQLTKELDWLKESVITPASSDVSREMKRSSPAAR